MSNGTISYLGNIEDCIKKYMISSREIKLGNVSLSNRNSRTNGNVIFTMAQPVNNGRETWDFNYDEDILFNFEVIAQKKNR